MASFTKAQLQQIIDRAVAQALAAQKPAQTAAPKAKAAKPETKPTKVTSNGKGGVTLEYANGSTSFKAATVNALVADSDKAFAQICKAAGFDSVKVARVTYARKRGIRTMKAYKSDAFKAEWQQYRKANEI
jgi:hypothetical protein